MAAEAVRWYLFQLLNHLVPLGFPSLPCPSPRVSTPLLLTPSSCFLPRSMGSGSTPRRTSASYMSWREGSHDGLTQGLLAWNERF